MFQSLDFLLTAAASSSSVASSSKNSLLLQIIWRENLSVVEMENLPVLTTLLDVPDLQLLQCLKH